MGRPSRFRHPRVLRTEGFSRQFRAGRESQRPSARPTWRRRQRLGSLARTLGGRWGPVAPWRANVAEREIIDPLFNASLTGRVCAQHDGQDLMARGGLGKRRVGIPNTTVRSRNLLGRQVLSEVLAHAVGVLEGLPDAHRATTLPTSGGSRSSRIA